MRSNPPYDRIAMTSADASYSELFRNIVRDVQDLLRSEFRLAKAEFKQDVQDVKMAAMLLAAGSIIVLFGALFLISSAVLALALAMPPWSAALVVAVVLGACGGVTLRAGFRRIKQNNLGPDRTVEGLREMVK